MKLSIKAKLITAFIILIALSGVIYFLGVSSLAEINTNLNTIVDKNAERMRLSGELNESIQFVSKRVKDLMLERSAEGRDELVRTVETRDRKMQSQLEEMRQLSSQEGRAIIDKFSTAWKKYMADLDQVVAFTQLNSDERAGDLSREQGKDAFERTTQTLLAIIENSRNEGAANALDRIATAALIYDRVANTLRQEKNMILSGTVEKMNAMHAQAVENDKKIQDLISRLQNLKSPRTASYIDKLEYQYNDYYKIFTQVKTIAVENGDEKAY